MVAQGLTGSFSTALQKLILQYAGERNLVRATALTASKVLSLPPCPSLKEKQPRP